MTRHRSRLEARGGARNTEIAAIVADALKFLSGLEFTLRQGLPQEKLTALRQCITRIHINKPARKIKLTLRTIPTGNLDAVQELSVALVRQIAVIAGGVLQAPRQMPTHAGRASHSQ